MTLSSPAAKATTGGHGMESVLSFLRRRHMDHSQLWLELRTWAVSGWRRVPRTVPQSSGEDTQTLSPLLCRSRPVSQSQSDRCHPTSFQNQADGKALPQAGRNTGRPSPGPKPQPLAWPGKPPRSKHLSHVDLRVDRCNLPS